MIIVLFLAALGIIALVINDLEMDVEFWHKEAEEAAIMMRNDERIEEAKAYLERRNNSLLG